MTGRLKKALPAGIRELVESGDVAAAQAALAECLPDATSRREFGRSALGFPGAPAEVVAWLLERGADPHLRDGTGSTPVHQHALSPFGSLAVLLAHGARPDVVDDEGRTPLFGTFYARENARLLLDAGADPNAVDADGVRVGEWLLHIAPMDLVTVVPVIELLHERGARPALGDADRVREIVAGIDADDLGEEGVAEAVDRLCTLFGVAERPRPEPVPAPAEVTTITVTGEDEEERFARLWDLLVPASGVAATAQGEAVRIVGRVVDEIHHQGAVNWGRRYHRAMLDHLPELTSRGTPLPEGKQARLRALVRGMRSGRAEYEELVALRAVVLDWVGANAVPLPLGPVDYPG